MTDRGPYLPPVSRQAPGEEIELRRWWYACRQHWPTLLTALLVSLAAGAAITFWQTPRYESEATVRLTADESRLQILENLPGALGAAAQLGGGGSGLQTDLALLESRRVAEVVVDSLDLRVRLLSPELPRREVLRVFEAPRSPRSGRYELEHLGGGSYSVAASNERSLSPERVEIGRPFRLLDVTLALDPTLRSSPPEQLEIEIVSFRNAVAAVRQELDVKRLPSGATVVAIKYQDADPILAAAVPNTAVQSFIASKNRLDHARTRNTIDFLQGQSDEYEAELRNAEDRLQNFREREQIVEPKAEAAQDVTRLAELRANRDALAEERQALRGILSDIENAGDAGAEVSAYRQLAGFPTFISNGLVQSILNSLIQLENERAKLLVLRTSRNADVVGIDRRVNDLELQLYRLARDYVQGLDSKIASLNGTLAGFEQRLEQVPSREVQYQRLLRRQKLLEDVYTLIQTRLKEGQIQAASEVPSAQLIDAAMVPDAPTWPKLWLNLLIATVVGTLAGFAAILARETVKPTVRTREDVALATSGLPVLGTIPSTRTRLLSGLRPLLGSGNGRGRNLSQPSPKHGLITRSDPGDPASEAYRALRTNLIFSPLVEDTPRVLVVTSATLDDGKSSSAANLAVAMAQQGTRTLLVDADLRRGRLHDAFAQSRGPGLSELLLGEVSVSDAIRTLPGEDHGKAQLHLLPSGMPPVNPAEMLGSAALRDTLIQLRSLYDMIVLDTPPLNFVTDAAVLALAADAVILVARNGRTPKEGLQDAANQLRHLRIPVTGVVLNDVESAAYGRYSSDGVHAE